MTKTYLPKILRKEVKSATLINSEYKEKCFLNEINQVLKSYERI